MNDKGILSLKFLIQIVLMTAIIFLAIGVFNTAWASLLGGGEEEAYIRNVDNMADKVEALLDTPATFEKDTDTFQIGEDYTLIGFDSETVSTVATKEGNNQISRPEECNGQSCLCMYSEKIEIQEDTESTLVRCWKVGNDVVLYGSVNPSNTNIVESVKGGTSRDISLQLDVPDSLKSNPEYLVIYGSEMSAENYREFYIEKYSSNDKDYVMIAPNRDDLRVRHKYVGECDEESSDDLCSEGQKFSDIVRLRNYPVGHTGVYSCEKYGETDRCTATVIDDCKINSGKPIEEPCACGDKAYSSGYCIQFNDRNNGDPFYSPIPCVSGDVPTESANNLDRRYNQCSDYKKNRNACKFNYCKIEGGCEYASISGENTFSCT